MRESSGVVFLVIGVAFLIRHVMEQSELRTQEKLLEIDYRLAELAEIVRSNRPPRSSEDT